MRLPSPSSPNPAFVSVTKAAQLPPLFATHRACGHLTRRTWRRYEVPEITWYYGVESRPATSALTYLTRACSYGETSVTWTDVANPFRTRHLLGTYLVWPTQDTLPAKKQITSVEWRLHALPFEREEKVVEQLDVADTGWAKLTLPATTPTPYTALPPGVRVLADLGEFTNCFAPGDTVWKYEFYQDEAVLTKHDFLGLTRPGRVAMYRYSPFAPHAPLACELAPEYLAGWVVQDTPPRTWPAPRVPLASILTSPRIL